MSSGLLPEKKDFIQDTQANHLLPDDKQSAQITTTNLSFNSNEVNQVSDLENNFTKGK
jgi:hypothetical protein